jgi:hypothetical protein
MKITNKNLQQIIGELSKEINLKKDDTLYKVIEQETYLHKLRCGNRPCKFNETYFYSAIGHIRNEYNPKKRF